MQVDALNETGQGLPTETRLTSADIQGGLSRARYKLILNQRCRDWVEKLLRNLFGENPSSVSIVQRLNNATFNLSSQPSSFDYGDFHTFATTGHGTYSVTIYPYAHSMSPSDFAVGLIHEAFHMGPQAKDDFQMWQASVGNFNISLPHTPEGLRLASSSWNRMLQQHCQ